MEKINPNIENEFPTRQNRAQYLAEKYGDMYNTNISRRAWYTSGERNPWILADRLLANFVGEKFDKFFSELSERCKHNDLLMQYKYVFERSLEYTHHDRFWKFSEYYVDDEGIIRKRNVLKRRKKKIKSETPKEWYELRDAYYKSKREEEEKEYNFKHEKVERISPDEKEMERAKEKGRWDYIEQLELENLIKNIDEDGKENISKMD